MSNSKSNKHMPNSKASYAILIERPKVSKTQSQTPISNQFQVLEIFLSLFKPLPVQPKPQNRRLAIMLQKAI